MSTARVRTPRRVVVVPRAGARPPSRAFFARAFARDAAFVAGDARAIMSSARLGPVWTKFFLGAAIVLATLKRLATALITVLSLTSRWKYLTYQVYSTLILQLGAALSPLLVLGLSTAFGLAIEMAATLDDIAGTIHAHPTLGEAFQEASLRTLGHALHI